MQRQFYKQIEGINLPRGVDRVYLTLCFDKDTKNIWNKQFNFYISNCPCGSSEINYFISKETLAKVYRIAVGEIEKTKDKLINGECVPIATIKNGKIKDLTKTI